MRSTPGPLQQMNCFHAVHFELTKYTRRGPDTKGSLSTANKHDSMMPSNSTSRFGYSIAVCNVKRGDEGQNRWNNAILVQVTWLPMDLQRWQSQLFPSCKATVCNRHEVTSYVRDCPLTRLPSSWIANCISVGRIFRHQEYLIWAGATKAINTLIRKNPHLNESQHHCLSKDGIWNHNNNDWETTTKPFVVLYKFSYKFPLTLLLLWRTSFLWKLIQHCCHGSCFGVPVAISFDEFGNSCCTTKNNFIEIGKQCHDSWCGTAHHFDLLAAMQCTTHAQF